LLNFINEKAFRDHGSDCVRKFMKEGNYILIIGILIAACIALYNRGFQTTQISNINL